MDVNSIQELRVLMADPETRNISIYDFFNKISVSKCQSFIIPTIEIQPIISYIKYAVLSNVVYFDGKDQVEVGMMTG